MSQPAFRLIPQFGNNSFVFKYEPFGLHTRWHYHPELELIFFIKGTTSAIIGNEFKEFEEEDLVFLGGNFPHVLQESQRYKKQHPKVQPFGLIIQFTEDFLGKDFFDKPEMSPIKDLIYKANKGIRIKPEQSVEIRKKLTEMVQLSDTGRLIGLLDVLWMMSEVEDYEWLLPHEYQLQYHEDEERMNNIHQYVYKNFLRPISNKEIAAVANMTEASFCRYFKSRSLKTFTRFLNEVRIAYACKLLSEKNKSVTDVCFASGFEGLPYFSKKFKEIMGFSPKSYQRKKMNFVRKEKMDKKRRF